MSSVSFFTPIQFQDDHSWQTKACQGIEDYFVLSKTHDAAFETVGENKVIIQEREYKFSLATVLKVATIFTIVLPLIVLCAKAVMRFSMSYEVTTGKQELEKEIVLEPSHLETIEGLSKTIVSYNTYHGIPTIIAEKCPMVFLTEKPIEKQTKEDREAGSLDLEMVFDSMARQKN